ncbi:E3 ubiquitin-protein ligase DCST1 [Cephus cinctus]|uniref:E3 ubiquitin-protein ligase DCST1 n=1 Tax=Cephus cinctus TaxID=211228 RepID=A0AAJ7FDH2_CEPCN|nr:E3 ubiquitin-protein ligase DCST1 [Cephus cinctus]
MPGLENMNRGGRIAQHLQLKFLRSFAKSCPRLYGLCYDPIGTHKKARAVIGFFLGFFLGVIFYEVIISDLQFDRYTSLALGAVLIVILSIGCAASIQVRCVCLLTIPAFCGRAGRSVLKALVLGYVIAGPIFNLTYNGKEVVRTFACTTQLTHNLTKTRFDLMFKPFQEAIFGIRTDANEVKDTLSSVKDLSSPIVEEIEGEEEMRRINEENDYLDVLQDDTKRSEEIKDKEEKAKSEAKSEGDIYEAQYRAKIEARCEEQMSRGSERCRDMFGEGYDKCYDTVTWIAGWLLCWPMKLTFICNIVQALGGSSICDPDGKIDTGIGEGYAKLKNSKNKLSASLKDAKLQFKVKIPPSIVDVREAGDTAKAVLHDFNVRKQLFDTVMTIIKRCLAFVFLKIIITAQTYHDKYLTDIEFDNIYVTSYFRRIDARRKARGSLTLLPMKKIERAKFVDPYGLKPSKVERANLIGQTGKLILEMVTATTFVLLDRLFYETLDLVRRHAHIEYMQAGRHDMTLDVRGTGMIATMIRSVIKGFNVKKRIKTVVSNEACLPRPNELSNYVLAKIYGTYLGIWIMLLLAAYTQRLRRLICSFFYRKREKRRVLYLYNETLRRRLGYFRFMKGKVRALVRARLLERDMDPWVALRLRYPKFCGWLSFFSCARQKCLICAEPETRKGPKFRRCTTPGCNFVHCPECWRDVGRICFACAKLPDTDSEDYDTQGEF